MPELVKAPKVSPTKIFQLSCAYWNSKALLSAAEIGIFATLGNGSATADEIRDELGLDPLALRDFLDTLAALGLLVRDGDRYRNDAEIETYLVPGNPNYMGGYLEFVDKVVWPAWEGLSGILRNGKPQFPPPDAVGGRASENEVAADEVYEQEIWGKPEMQRLFLEGADGLNTEIAWEMTRRIDWSKWTSLVDLGGARGNVASIILTKNPHLSATIFDLPILEPLFTQLMASRGLESRARFQPGDWFADPLPEGDALLCSHALHNWNTEERRTVIRKAYDAVRPGGVLMICELMLDDQRERLNPLMLSLLMKLGMRGSGYTIGECRALMAEVGFADIEAVTLQDYDQHTVMIGHKPQ